MTRIFADNTKNKKCIYLIINKIKICANLRYPRHLRSKLLLGQPQKNY